MTLWLAERRKDVTAFLSQLQLYWWWPRGGGKSFLTSCLGPRLGQIIWASRFEQDILCERERDRRGHVLERTFTEQHADSGAYEENCEDTVVYYI